MGLLASIGIKKEKIIDLMNHTDGEWMNITVDVNDQVDTYGNNVKLYEQQTKEQRESKATKNYIANGRVFWTDGKVAVAPKKEKSNDPFA